MWEIDSDKMRILNFDKILYIESIDRINVYAYYGIGENDYICIYEGSEIGDSDHYMDYLKAKLRAK